MELSMSAVEVLVESVWAVSARRAFDDGYNHGVYARAGMLHESKQSRLAHAEDVHNAAMVLVCDEVFVRLSDIRERLQTLHDRATVETSYGKGQRCVLRRALEELQTFDAVDPHADSTGTPSTRDKA